MSNDNISIFLDVIFPALLETLYMLFFTTISAMFFGFILSIILVLTGEDGLRPNEYIHQIFNTIINITRSFPFIILMVSIIPFTRFIVGTSIGKKAAIVPLTISATPYVTRLFEGAFKEVDKKLIEVAKSFGASDFQIIFKIMLNEAVPSIISGMTLATISVLGASAVAGTVGAGGLGAVAITYGYQNFNDKIMYGTVFFIIILVQAIQSLGNFLYRKLK